MKKFFVLCQNRSTGRRGSSGAIFGSAYSEADGLIGLFVSFWGLLEKDLKFELPIGSW